MASAKRSRKPSGILVNGVSVFIQDPNAAANGLFTKFIRIPGVGSITLPDEAAPSTDTPTVDGSIGAVGFAPIGTIAIPLPALSEHPVHKELERLKEAAATVTVSVRKPATKKFAIKDLVAAGGVAVAANGRSAVTIATTVLQARVKALIREGFYVAFAGATADALVAADPDPGVVVGYLAAGPAADNEGFQAVLTVNEDGTEFEVSPGYAGKNTDAAVHAFFRQPGKEWLDIECLVGQMAPGDFQAGANVAGNLVLSPTLGLPPTQTVVTISEEGGIDI